MSTTHPTRVPWLDPESETPLIDDQVHRLRTFMEAMADGKITDQELAEQETRLVDWMKKVEPTLTDAQHADVTRLLCELTSYNIMKLMHTMARSGPRTRFRG